jgi:polyisoprenoid-binding protein YceI
MKKLLITGLIVLIYSVGYSQLYMTRTGYISFFSTMPLEDIKADNNQVYAVIDPAKKAMAFTLLMKSFLFAKELQQEHFNENYAESDKYPKASFTGTYVDEVDLTRDGTYPITVKGTLVIHGVTKPIEAPATLEVKAGHLIGQCILQVIPEDYNINIPSVVRDKIAKQVVITIKIDCSPVK